MVRWYWRGNTEVLVEKNCPSPTLCATNHIWTRLDWAGLWVNPGLCCNRLTTNYLSHGITAFTLCYQHDGLDIAWRLFENHTCVYNLWEEYSYKIKENRRTNASSSNSSNMVRIRHVSCTVRQMLPQNANHILDFIKVVWGGRSCVGHLCSEICVCVWVWVVFITIYSRYLYCMKSLTL